MLKVYTLGHISLQDDHGPLSGFVSQKAEVLFIYLLLHPRIHQREVIAAQFWNDTTAEQSMKNLRTALIPFTLDNFITVTKGVGHLACAATLYGAQFRQREVLNLPVVARDRDYHQERMDARRAALGADDFEQHYASGQAMDYAEAVAYAQRCYFQTGRPGAPAKGGSPP